MYIVSLMRKDWNERARADVVYWINNAYGHGVAVDALDAVFADGVAWAKTLTAPALERLAFEPRGRDVLDIGCGIGRLFPGFAALGFEQIYGIDVSDEMVKVGREACRVPNARFFVSNGLDFTGLKDESVDFCFSYNVLSHTPSQAVVWRNLGEVFRVLRPGGIFQLHLRDHHPVKRRLLARLPVGMRPTAHTLLRVASLRWLAGGAVRSGVPGSQSTLELAVATPRRRIEQRLRSLGAVDIATLDDISYADGTRYWAIGRKPTLSPG
jgi:SAM-dependent methyltransferase